ncbi:hypothetical protein L873DRAFT_1280444 [Choiromyces venosus 120613-1]|uniref:Uncharacterized protein n=1 Tax=Choiromyces venosus 120613-1 TaxID=1336337 RepID=A0A3N4KFS8_9PEZI|nr:hypothetical protein L873DRAFT_1280444 [Choiromyces venosus 120613-1]
MTCPTKNTKSPCLPGHPHQKALVYPGTHTYRGVPYDTPHEPYKKPWLTQAPTPKKPQFTQALTHVGESITTCPTNHTKAPVYPGTHTKKVPGFCPGTHTKALAMARHLLTRGQLDHLDKFGGTGGESGGSILVTVLNRALKGLSHRGIEPPRFRRLCDPCLR